MYIQTGRVQKIVDAENVQKTQEERFLKVCCERDPDAKARPSELYASYVSWCLDHEYEPLSLTTVAAQWRRLGLRRVTLKGYPYYRGVRVLVPGDDKITFRAWLLRQRHRSNESIAMLAEEVSKDRAWPNKGRPTLESYVEYLKRYNSPEWFVEILRGAWSEYQEYLAKGVEKS